MSRRHSGNELPPSTPGAHARRLLIGLVLWFGLFALAERASRPPVPLPVDAPQEQFSAQRAVVVLDRLIDGLGGPHPTGSEAADQILERVRSEVIRLGWDHEIQEAIGMSSGGSVGRMRNLVARRVGRLDQPAVLVAAHYDSVGAGPGISDDLASVAAMLEIGRALGDDGLPRTVILLFTDGEEAGLVGAEAFLEGHPWAAEVGTVLNLEARGVSGPSHMFQTGADNAWLVSAWGEEAARPDANSVSAEVYRRMPNDTDFTVFLQRGLAGLNFAFIGDMFAYHTPLDDREHLSLSSLQHQGEQVLAGVRALEERDVEPVVGEAVYATLFGRYLLWTSTELTRLIALVGSLGLLWSLQRAVYHGRLSWGRAFAGLLWTPVGLLLPGLLALGYVALLRALTGTPSPWHASAFPSWIALVGGLMLCASFTGAIGARLASPLGLALSCWAVWGLLGLFVAIFMPGASYLFAWPALGVALCANGVRLKDAVPARVARISLFSILISVPLWAPVLLGLATAFGVDSAPLALVALAFPASLLLPLIGLAPPLARQVVGGLGSIWLVVGVVMTALPPYQTEDRPGRLNLVYAASGETDLWQAWSFGQPLPEDLAGAADWSRGAGAEGLRWDGITCWSAPAPDLERPLPAFEQESSSWNGEGDLVLEGRVCSPNSAARTSVEIGGSWEVRAVVVEGRQTEHKRRLELIAPGWEGLAVRFVLRPVEPRAEPESGPESGPNAENRRLELRLVDRVYGLPTEAHFLGRARGGAFVPSHGGDGMLLVSRTELLVPPPP